MKRTLLILSLLLTLVALPALAGEGKKCTASTQDCLNKMVSHLKNKGLIGVDGEWDDSTGGFKIASFMEGTHAEAAGVRTGDVLVAINGIPLKDEEASMADRANRKPGAEVTITVSRDGEKHDMKVKMIALSEEQVATYVGQHMMEHAVIAQAD
jgi:C-terminal processing protease CtpA/Prc